MLRIIDTERKDTPIADARVMVDMMLKQNPSSKADDPKIYFNTLLAIMCAYPPSVSKSAVHPVEGIVASSQFQIKPSDLKKWLDAKMEERGIIKRNAILQKAEHKRRAEDQSYLAKVEREREHLTVEQRRQRAEEARRLIRLPPENAMDNFERKNR